MMKLGHLHLLDFVVVTFNVILLIASSSADVEEETEPPQKEIVPHPDLPDFQDGVSVRILERLESCARMASSGNWLELHFVAKQMNDEGEYEEFDSTESRERPLLIAVDDKEKLPGLSEGLRDVCVGEKREITIQVGSPLMQVDLKSGLTQPQTDRPAVYEVMVQSILDQKPVNIFAKMDLDDNKQLSREELKSYFREHGLEDIDDDTMDIVINGFLRSNDMDTNDHLSDAEFPHPYEHMEL